MYTNLAVLPLALMLGAGAATTGSGPIADSSVTVVEDKVTSTSQAMDLTGKWQGQTPNGMSLTLDLVQKDEAFTGTLTREADTVSIADGKVTKDTFSFTATLGGETEAITGKVVKDEMTAWLVRQGPDRAATLKRVK